MPNVTGDMIAERAYAFRDSKIPYSQWDCQAFVEEVMRTVGMYKNYRGSNHMYREMVYDIRPCAGITPEKGELLFTVKHDGKEPATYKDGINAAHVGIYTGYGKGAMHSSANGVEQTAYPASRWTHCAKIIGVGYGTDTAGSENTKQTAEEALALIESIIRTWRNQTWEN